MIPVDFTINTEVAVAKALDLADAEGTTLHLLHVQRVPVMAQAISTDSIAEKLKEWKESIEAYMPSVMVHCQIAEDVHVHQCIQQAAVALGADLVVLGKSSGQTWMPFLDTVQPMKLAEQTKIPVLTVKPGALHTRLKTVVVPLSSELPQSKMEAIRLLCRRHKPCIHLLAFGTGQPQDTGPASALIQVYQWIKSIVHCPVEYALLQNGNTAKEILAYAEKVNADMILAYPDAETKIDFLNRHIPDMLPYASKVQVLAVQPAN